MDPREVAQIAGDVFDAKKYRIRTHLIAQVTAYDAATNTVSVQPVTRAIRLTDPENLTTVDLPQVSEVPVHQGGSGKLWCTVAPAVDTYGLLHISDRIIDDWLHAGGIVDPTGIRCHDLSDAVFYPSLLHLAEEGDNGKLAVPVETDRISLRTRAGTTEVSVLENDSILLSSTGDVVVQDGSDWAVQFTAMKTAFDNLKNELNALVTAYNAHIHITTATIGLGPAVGVIAPTVSTGTPPVATMDSAKVENVRFP